MNMAYPQNRFIARYSTDQVELLHPIKYHNPYQSCGCGSEDPDFECYPLAREAGCVSFILNPGELIIKPAGWFIRFMNWIARTCLSTVFGDSKARLNSPHISVCGELERENVIFLLTIGLLGGKSRQIATQTGSSIPTAAGRKVSNV